MVCHHNSIDLNGNKRALALGLAILSAAYLLTMPVDFTIGDSAAELSLAGSNGTPLRASHLLTTPLYSHILLMGTLIGLEGQPLLAAQIVNIALGLASSFLLYRVLLRLGYDRHASLFLMLVGGLTNAVWSHSIVAETGIHPQFFFLIAVWVLAHVISSKQGSYVLLASCLMFLCISVLFALYMVVFLPGTIVTLLLATRTHKDLSFFGVLGAVTGTLVVFLAIPFAVSAISEGIHSYSGFVNWLLFHPEQERLSHITGITIERLARSLGGLVAAFIDPRDGLTLVKLTLRREEFQGVGPVSLVRLCFGLVIVLSLGTASMASLIRLGNRPMLLFCGVNLSILFVFNAFWLGSDPQFWLPGLPLVLILAGAWLSRLRLGTHPARFGAVTGIVLLLLAMLAANVPSELPSLLFPDGGEDVKLARSFAAELRDGDTVLSPGGSWVNYVNFVDSPGNVRVVNLVYGNLGSGLAFYTRIDEIVDEAHLNDRRVYFEGIMGPPLARQFGPWEMVDSLRGVSRKELIEHLNNDYLLQEPSGFPEAGVVEVLQRSRGEQTSEGSG